MSALVFRTRSRCFELNTKPCKLRENVFFWKREGILCSFCSQAIQRALPARMFHSTVTVKNTTVSSSQTQPTDVMSMQFVHKKGAPKGVCIFV